MSESASIKVEHEGFTVEVTGGKGSTVKQIRDEFDDIVEQEYERWKDMP